MLMLAGSPGKKEPKELSTRQNIMSLLSLSAMQSLRLHDETKEAVKQKTEDKGGSAVPGETTQPIAT
jgi:hypothetical protein